LADIFWEYMPPIIAGANINAKYVTNKDNTTIFGIINAIEKLTIAKIAVIILAYNIWFELFILSSFLSNIILYIIAEEIREREEARKILEGDYEATVALAEDYEYNISDHVKKVA